MSDSKRQKNRPRVPARVPAKWMIVVIGVLMAAVFAGCSAEKEAAAETTEAVTTVAVTETVEVTVPETTPPETTEAETETETETEPVPEKTEYRFVTNANELPAEFFCEDPYENFEGTEAVYVINKEYISEHFDELENPRNPGVVVIDTKIKAPEGAVKAVHEDRETSHEVDVRDGYITRGTGIRKNENGSLLYNLSYSPALIWYDAEGKVMNEEPEVITICVYEPHMAAQMAEVKAGLRRFVCNASALPEVCFKEAPEEIGEKNTVIYTIDHDYVSEHFDELVHSETEPFIIVETMVKAPEGAVKGIHRNEHDDPEFRVEGGFIRAGARIRKNDFGEMDFSDERLRMVWYDAEGNRINLSPEELTFKMAGGPTILANAEHLDAKCFTEAPVIVEEDGEIDITYRIDRQYVESHFEEIGGGKRLGVVVRFAVPETAVCRYNCKVSDGIQEKGWYSVREILTSTGKVEDQKTVSEVHNFKDGEGKWVGSTKLVLHFLADDFVPNETIHPAEGTLTPGYTGIAGPHEQVKEGEKRLLPADYFTRPAEYDPETGVLDLWISDARCRQKENRFYDNTISVAYSYPDDWKIVKVNHPSYNFDKDRHEVWVDVNNMELIGAHGGWTGYYAFTYGGLAVEKPVITFEKPDGTPVDVTFTIRYHRS